MSTAKSECNFELITPSEYNNFVTYNGIALGKSIE